MRGWGASVEHGGGDGALYRRLCQASKHPSSTRRPLPLLLPARGRECAPATPSIHSGRLPLSREVPRQHLADGFDQLVLWDRDLGRARGLPLLVARDRTRGLRPSIRSLIWTSPFALLVEPWMTTQGAPRRSAYFICAFMPDAPRYSLGADACRAQLSRPCAGSRRCGRGPSRARRPGPASPRRARSGC